ncbi:hypothetical protein [Calidifontibacter terrae]
MADLLRVWWKRAVAAIVIAVATWWIAGLVGYHSRLAVDIALALLIAAGIGLTHLTGPAWAVSMPTAPTTRTRAALTQDARLSYLRRTLQDTAAKETRADTHRTSPMGLQRSLRAVAAHRASQRLARPLDPEDRETLAHHLDPVLAEYLCPTTPPPVDEHRLDDLIRRIENL